MTGLTRKVVVVDEAHAYDPYMQGLLRRALTWLAAAGVPVVLLSATLSGRLARALVGAYLEGLPKPVRIGAADQFAGMAIGYPGWVHVDASTGTCTSGEVPASGRETDLRIVVEPYVTGQASGSVNQALAAAVTGLCAEVLRGDADGNVLVVCNTVSDAVGVYTSLSAAAHESCAVRVMHSRFPHGERRRQVDEVNRLYGKGSRTSVESRAPERPTRSVLVATQVVEQSLDLDMDWVISDLAPAAMLLQRAGRGHRHHTYLLAEGGDPVQTVRPDGMAVPTLTVLVPTREDGTLVDRDQRPYDQTLLAATREALVDRGGRPMAVPGDVQSFIDRVYDTDFGSALTDEAMARYVTRAATTTTMQSAAAALATIPSPRAVTDLAELTSAESQDGAYVRYGTRYGINTVTVLPVWRHDAEVHLDPAGTVRLPGGDGPVTRAGLRTIVEHAVTVPGGDWEEAARDLQPPPPSWAAVALLRDVILVPFTGPLPAVATVSVPRGTIRLEMSTMTGFLIRREGPTHA